jgi:hypothetical protein
MSNVVNLSDHRPEVNLIPARPCTSAVYILGEPGEIDRFVEAWRADGAPLVADVESGRLVPADSLEGFLRIKVTTADVPESFISTVAGWRLDEGTPLPGWAEGS